MQKRELWSRLVAPFGKYRISDYEDADGAQRFVGREGQRAFLIEALLNGGRRGAYLITGRRGVGKTTFVESCLSEYDNAVTKRFLRARSNRFFGAAFFTIILAFVVSFILLVTSEAMEFFAAGDHILLKIFLIPTLLVCASPIILACRVLERCWGLSSRAWKSETSLWRILATVVCMVGVPVGFLFMAIHLPVFGAPSLSMAHFFLAFTALIYMGDLCWIFSKPKPLGDKLSQNYLCRIILWTFVVAGAAPIFILMRCSVIHFVLAGSTSKSSTIELYAAIISGVILFSASKAFTALRLWWEIKKGLSSSQMISSQVLIRYGAPCAILIIGMLVIAPITGNLHFKFAPGSSSEHLIFSPMKFLLILVISVFCACGIFAAQVFLKKKKFPSNTYESHRFTPPSDLLMHLKAFFLIVVGLQMLYPALNQNHSFFAPLMEEMEPVVSDSSSEKPARFRPFTALSQCSHEEQSQEYGLCYQKTNEDVPSTGGEASPPPYFTLFTAHYIGEEAAWVVIVALILLLIYHIEYEWINRALIDQQDTGVLERGPRPRWRPHHHADLNWAHSSDVEIPTPADPIESREYEALRYFRHLQEATFPWIICRLWAPIIVVRVNLGFDSLDHRGVTHAMLYGLRNAYRRRFMGFWSPYQAISNLLLLLLILALVRHIGKELDFPEQTVAYSVGKEDILFSMRAPDERLTEGWFLHRDTANDVPTLDYCRIIDETRLMRSPEWNGGGLAAMLCALSPDMASAALPLLFATVVPVPEPPNTDHLIQHIMHPNNGLPVLEIESDLYKVIQDRTMSLRMYHLILFVFLWLLFHNLTRRFPLAPYARSLRSIDQLRDSLDKRVVERRSREAWAPIRWLRSLIAEDVQSEHTREQLDPRSVELAFLSLLENVQRVGKGRRSLQLPPPEITFVFDELDKVTGLIGAPGVDNTNAAEEAGAIDAERRRAYAFRALLSDMKRLISSAPARFIFVGNRLLHDEWIADQGNRQKSFLASVFDTEIYLPSLLVDHPLESRQAADSKATNGKESREPPPLSLRIQEYFYRTHRAAQARYETYAISRRTPFFWVPNYDAGQPRFPESPFKLDKAFAQTELVDLDARKMFKRNQASQEQEKWRSEQFDDAWRQAFFSQFCNALAYRSVGTPKRLAELFNSFTRPAGRLSEPDFKDRENILHCSDVLLFNPKDVYRIQLLDSLFSHIQEKFGHQLAERDDKVAVNVIYIFDFILKFHGRAFSWSSLERIDELIHIHRSPDLRRMLEAIVDGSSEHYLHRLLNGMYAFRVRSALAVELRYLSRLSEPEMAAFNFTLDESQSLKASYTHILNTSNLNIPNADIVSGLGELYEYDGEYEVARAYYTEAMSHADDQFAQVVGQTLDLTDPVRDLADKWAGEALHNSPGSTSQQPSYNHNLSTIMISARHSQRKAPFIGALLSGDAYALKSIQAYPPWAIRRLRLMLQIGMTFEQSRDLERAKAHYNFAHQFALALTDALFPDQSAWRKLSPQDQRRVYTARSLFKHINLLYQPAIAEAWVAEKFVGGVDTSSAIVESELINLRRRLPFLDWPAATKSEHIDAFSTSTQQTPDEVDDTSHGPESNRVGPGTQQTPDEVDDTPHGPESNRVGPGGDSNFALIGSEMHNKAGDLYFYKGRHAPPRFSPSEEGISCNQVNKQQKIKAFKNYIDREQKKQKPSDLSDLQRLYGTEGYLFKAHYHYAVALHEVRRYLVYRRHASRQKFSIFGKSDSEDAGKQTWNTFEHRQWPSFAIEAVYSNFTDLAEATLARVSLLTLWKDLTQSTQRKADCLPPNDGDPHAVRDAFWRFHDTCVQWMELTDEEVKEEFNRLERGEENEIHKAVAEFLGEWALTSDELLKADPKIVVFSGVRSTSRRLLVSLMLSLSASRFANMGGYQHDESREVLIVLETIAQHLKWFRFITGSKARAITELAPPPNAAALSFIRLLAQIAQFAIKQYENACLSSWEGRRVQPDSYQIGGAFGVEAARVVLSMTLSLKGIWDNTEADEKTATQQADAIQTERKALKKIADAMLKGADAWFGSSAVAAAKADAPTNIAPARLRMQYLIQRHRFPAINQMNALKELIDDAALSPDFSNPEDINETYNWFFKMVEMERQVAAPMHFTPSLIASSAAFLYIHAPKEEINRDRDQELKRLARRKLQDAEEAFSMGRQYYSSISGLYYLYDDFNDRQLHANHALQMGSADILALLDIILPD